MFGSKYFPSTKTMIVIVTSLLTIISCWSGLPKLISFVIFKRIALVEGNEVYDIWKKQPFPLKFKVYLFNVSNTEEVQNGGTPIVKEVGPFVYDEYWERINVTTNEDDDTTTFMLKRTFYFNEQESCRSEDQVVTIINSALIAMALQIYYIAPSIIPSINEAVPYLFKNSKDVFLRTTVHDILFGGVFITCPEEVDIICGTMKAMLPPVMEVVGYDFKFSIFGHINRTLSGPYTIGRGIKTTKRGKIYSYVDGSELSVWNGATCNMINGSDSTLFYPMKTPPEKIYVFSSDVCRSIFISYEKDIKHEGINAWKYTGSPELMARSGDNQCFCPIVKDENLEDVMKCPKSGLIDLTSCLKAPIYLSYPHFLFGDPSLLKYVKGLKPNKTIHENFMYMEPTTGSPILGAKRIQLNSEIKQLDNFTLLNNVTDGVFPLLWVDEHAEVPAEVLVMLRGGLTIITYIKGLRWGFIVISIVSVIGYSAWTFYKGRIGCFSNMGSNTVSVIEIKQKKRAPPATNASVRAPVNSNLYPQTGNKNVSDRFEPRAVSIES